MLFGVVFLVAGIVACCCCVSVPWCDVSPHGIHHGSGETVPRPCVRLFHSTPSKPTNGKSFSCIFDSTVVQDRRQYSHKCHLCLLSLKSVARVGGTTKPRHPWKWNQGQLCWPAHQRAHAGCCWAGIAKTGGTRGRTSKPNDPIDHLPRFCVDSRWPFQVRDPIKAKRI